MLERFVDLVLDRLARDPGMHVYHYGGYESGALKRLMQRHATREDEVDVLLRGRVLVNLYDHVVRQGIRASVESYSIKKLETFYMPERRAASRRPGSASSSTSAGWRPATRRSWRRSRPTTATTASRTCSCASGWRPAGARGRSPVPRTGSSPGRSRPTGPRRRTSRPRRRRHEPGRRRCARSCPWTGSRAMTPSRRSGCLPPSSTGIAARRSRSGGTTSAWSRRRSRSWCATGPRWATSRSSRTAGRARSRASIAIGSIRRRRREIREGKSVIALAPGEDGWAQSTVT